MKQKKYTLNQNSWFLIKTNSSQVNHFLLIRRFQGNFFVLECSVMYKLKTTNPTPYKVKDMFEISSFGVFEYFFDKNNLKFKKRKQKKEVIHIMNTIYKLKYIKHNYVFETKEAFDLFLFEKTNHRFKTFVI